MGKHKKLTPKERDFIAVWRSKGFLVREIARKLRKNPSTISRELKRNRWQDYYVAIHAQAMAARRKSRSSKRHPLKNKPIYEYVRKRLRRGWSPEQIAGRLKLKHGNNKHWQIHHETIYRYI
ncbi:helix-turn-helix domain-containing protein [Patescibacteria group bacterium]|nr:helix-turn-helix domain-containing protein [Patescibacteria group bacterium]